MFLSLLNETLKRGCWRYRWWLLGGALLGVGFIIPALWFIAVFGVMFFVHAAYSAQSGAERFFGGMLAGTLNSFLALSWYFYVYPVSWLPLEEYFIQIPVIFICCLISAVALSFGSGALAVLIGVLMRRDARFIALVPFLWVVAEVVNSFAFSIVTLGPQIMPNGHFSFGYLGYHLAQSPLFFPVASYGGVYALSLLGAGLGVLFYVWWQRRLGWQELVGGFIVLVMVGWFFSPTAPVVSQGIRVAIVDTYFDEPFLRSPGGTDEKQRILTEAIAAAQEVFPAYIILPEDSRFVPVDLTRGQVYPWFRFGRVSTDVVLVDSGSLVLSEGRKIVRGTIIDGKEATAYQLDKQYLVPQGEFVPYASQALFRSLGLGSFITTMSEARTYVPGPLITQENFPAHLPAIVFCFESVSPVAVRQAIGDRTVPFVAHPFSHAWFHSPTLLWRQLDTMLRVQARWSNTPIISAGNMGGGALYSKEGTKVEPITFAEGERYRVRIIDL